MPIKKTWLAPTKTLSSHVLAFLQTLSSHVLAFLQAIGAAVALVALMLPDEDTVFARISHLAVCSVSYTF